MNSPENSLKLILCLLLFNFFFHQSFAQAGKQQLKVLIPLYIHPNYSQNDHDNKEAWDEITKRNNDVDITIIFNESSGLRKTRSGSYGNAIKELQEKGITVLAYIPTTFANGDTSVIKKLIDHHYDNYINDGIDGFFFDEAVSGDVSIKANNSFHWPCYGRNHNCTPNVSYCEHCPESTYEQTDKVHDRAYVYKYYKALHDHAKSKSPYLKVVLNPGVRLHDDRFLDIADIIVTSETCYKKKDEQNGLTDNNGIGYSNQFAAMIHNVYDNGSQNIGDFLDDLAEKNFGYVYLTNTGIDNQSAPECNGDETWRYFNKEFWRTMTDEIADRNNKNLELERLGVEAREIAIGKNGTVCILAKDNYAYKLESNGIWQILGGPFQKIAVDQLGQPWVINSNNEVWRYDGVNWIFSTKAQEISFGGDGSYFVINMEGYIYKWDETVVVPASEDINKKWKYFPFTGNRPVKKLAIDQNGLPWVLADDGYAYNWDGKRWVFRHAQNSKDISIGPEGSVCVIGVDDKVWRWRGITNWKVANDKSGVTDIAVNPDGNPWILKGLQTYKPK